MTRVRIAPHLRRYFPAPERCEADGASVAELLADLERRFPGIAAYLVDETGALRQHVNLFLDNRLIADRRRLSDSLEHVEEVWVMQALSGG